MRGFLERISCNEMETFCHGFQTLVLKRAFLSVSLHLGFTVDGFLSVALLGNQLIGFLHFVLFDH